MIAYLLGANDVGRKITGMFVQKGSAVLDFPSATKFLNSRYR